MAQMTVDARWLEEQRAAGAPVVVCDVRWYLDGRSGREAHEAGHVPGAVFVDLDRCLAGPPSSAAGRHPLPDPAAFAACLGGAGVGDGDVVVAYDDAGGAVAARLVWMLRATGREAYLLDGGIDGWTGELDTGTVERSAAELTVVPWPVDRLAAIDEVAAAAGRRGAVVDVRAAARYRGETEPVDPRAGHIPGAVNVPVTELLDAASGRLLAPEEMRRRFEASGVAAGEEEAPIVYCGSGVNASFGVLALEHAGIEGRLYPGSWSQWSSDPDRPVATGEAP